MDFVIPMVAQIRGPPTNDVAHEQILTELHQEVGDDSDEIVAKEYGEINAVHGDWQMVQRKKYNKRGSVVKGNIYPIMRLEIWGVLK